MLLAGIVALSFAWGAA